MIAPNQTATSNDAIWRTISAHKFSNGVGFMNSYSDVYALMLTDNVNIVLDIDGYAPQSRAFTSDWASAAVPNGSVLIGAYLYVFYITSGATAGRVYRYDRTNLSAGGTLMTISGQAFMGTSGLSVQMTSDGTYFYFTFKAGNSANSYVVSKYSLSGTTLTYVSDITCGSTAFDYLLVNSNGLYSQSQSDGKIRKYNTSGTLQYTTIGFAVMQGGLVSIYGNPYMSFKESASAYAFLERVILT